MASNGVGLLIVGGGLASARAIKAYREHGGEGRITLVSADTVVPYHRPPLSKKFLRGETEAEDALVEDEAFYRDNDVDVLLETRVTELRPGEHVAVVDGADRRYDRLLIASGASPTKLDVPGADRDEVFSLRTLDDSRRIREAARDARHAVVVGAGFIGMEVAASLSQLGLEVTLVHRGEGLFEVLRARHVGQYLSELYGMRGVQLVLTDEVSEFAGREHLDSVLTKRGGVYQAELAVVGVGVRPNTEWLESSGLAVDDGVVVNERFETSAPGVHAVGDVARFYDPLFERHRRIEHWSNANYQGTEVGRVLARGDGGYDRVSTFFSEVFGVTFKIFGDVDHFDEIVFRGTLEDGDAIAFYLQGDRLVACLLVGQEEETENRLKELIAARATADPDRLAKEEVAVADAFAGPG
jgi:NADPH-dependent 2,4-dienoyl-CoA reductase/sulfur reductase-like enzyme